MRELTLPDLSLVVLVGASGAGKSTFARRHFGEWPVLSSDHYRGVVSDDPTDQSASKDAFETLEWIVRKRLARGLFTVIDATNLQAEHRKRWVLLAREFHVLPVAVVLDVPEAVCLERNAARPDRAFGAHVVRRHVRQARRSGKGLKREGFRQVHRLRGVDEIDAVTVIRQRPWTDRRDETGPFDLIGDVHGCLDELLELLAALGYAVERAAERYVVVPPEGRRVVFLGDLVDRGPASHEVLRLAMDMVEAGHALCVPGNHEAKLLRHLNGRNVKLTHGLDRTVEQLATTDDAFRARVRDFIDGLVSHFVLDGGALVVAHAGMTAEMAGRASGKVRQFALYGDTTGEIDAFGLPVRYPWARDYRGKAAVVYGHTPVPRAEWLNNTICLDTGCVFGGALTALRWPERERVSVPARQVWCAPTRPLEAAEVPLDDGLIDVAALLSGTVVDTRYDRRATIRPAHAVAALEVLARFAADPRWLVHLPPTMSPSETSQRPDLLEHPEDAFAYYRKVGVDEVVCQVKHMGSRAVVIVCRSAGVAEARFGFGPGEAPAAGAILTRRGRRFFDDAALEAALLGRVRAALDAADTWATLGSDWVILDAELMPWSAKAKALVEQQYAPVGEAAVASLGAAADVLRRAAERQPEAAALLMRYTARSDAAQAYDAAWRRYCWPVAALDDLRLAPFHVLASEGAVHTDRSHRWHLETIGAFCAHDPVLQVTEHRFVALDDAEAEAEATAWWAALTAAGGEGMVVKPARALLVRDERGLVQPALKCRGREYLRIIYGPEYTLPDQLDRLRKRGLRRKRSLALQEFALGLESLHRFVERRALHDVHACAFAILALESEPVDPRL